MQRLVLVPRWEGDATTDFYPWLGRKLEELEPALLSTPRVSSLLPRPDGPTIAASVKRWRETVLADGEPGQTIVIAHSVGCQVTMRGLATLEEPIAGCVFVGGWFSIDEPWESILPWQETELDLASTRAMAGRVRVLLSDDDPFTSDVDGTRARFESELGASVRVVGGARHFNRFEEPVVLDELLALARATQR
jgi:serine hydrolase